MSLPFGWLISIPYILLYVHKFHFEVLTFQNKWRYHNQNIMWNFVHLYNQLSKKCQNCNFISRYLSPMPSAFPGQIPPDRRYTDHEKAEPEISDTQASAIQNMWLPTSSPNMACTTNSEAANPSVSAQDQPASLVVRPMSQLTSKACRMVEAATNMWRYSPYEREHSGRLSANSPGISGHSDKSFIKSERMSPKLRATSVSS